MFHLNINSLQYDFDELQTILSSCPSDFQILGISESRLKTKSANDCSLLYIKDTINYKLRPDLNMEKEKELESIFIEILQKHTKIF